MGRRAASPELPQAEPGPLSPEQREDIARRIRAGEPLDPALRERLFPPSGTRRQATLVYPGKRAASELLAGPTAELRQNLAFGSPPPAPGTWSNMLIRGDNLPVLRRLVELRRAGELVNADGSAGLRLIYIDPPFGTAQLFHGRGRARAYSDKLTGAEFIEFLRARLVLLRELLAEDGSIYLHLDERRSHYLKVVMDEVFGEDCFQREIIWRIGWISGYKSAARNWIRNHDTILFYTRRPAGFVFNKRYLPYAEGYLRRDGKPPKGKGIPLEDTWNCSKDDELHSIQIMSFSGEKTGYPTQKNESLLRRIVEASSNPGDLVLDAFAGSGTTCAVAEQLGRRWVGLDLGKLAIQTCSRRLLDLRKRCEVQPFGRYDARAETDDSAPSVEWVREASEARWCARLVKFSARAPAQQDTRRRKQVEAPTGLDALAHVLVDLDHDGKILRPTLVLDGEQLRARAGRVELGEEHPLGQRIALICVDVYGNEQLTQLPVAASP